MTPILTANVLATSDPFHLFAYQVLKKSTLLITAVSLLTTVPASTTNAQSTQPAITP